MSDTVAIPPSPKSRRGWLKVLTLILGGVIVLLVAAYFVGTSSAFFKSVILPKVSKAIGVDVTVADASISPFSQIVLRDLKIQAGGTEPLVSAAEVRVRYSLMDIIGGKINVTEIALVSPTVSVVENADGTSNLDAFKQAAKKEAKPAATAAEPAKSLTIDVKAVDLKNATLSQLRNLKGGGRELVELSNVNVTLADLKNGQTGKLNLNADVKVDNNPLPPGTNAALQAKLSGNFTFDLAQDLKPTALKGNASLVVERAAGALSDLSAFAANLDCEATPAEIKQVALKFRKASADLGQLRVSGPFDLAKIEGKLQVQIRNIDRQVLNLAGGAQGIDFGSSILNSTNQVEIADGGKMIALAGQLTGSALSISQKGQTTPALDLLVGYIVTLDQSHQTASIQALTIDANRNQRPLLKGVLSKPMKLEWAKGANAVDQSAFNLALTGLNLTEWRAFLGTNVSSGQINAKLDIVSQQAGRQLEFSVTSDGSNLSAAFASNRIDQAEFNLVLRGALAEFRKLQLGNTELKLLQRGQAVASVTASGLLDLTTMDASFGVKLDASLPALAALAGMPGFEARTGSLAFNGHVAQTNLTPSQAKSPGYAQKVDGELKLAGFTGAYGDYRLEQWEAALACDLEMKDQQAVIRRLNGSLKQADQAAGTFDFHGSYHLTNQSGNVSLKLTDLNQNALHPFLASALGDKKLLAVTINANLEGRYDAKAESALKGDLQVMNLIVNDPKGQFPSTPMEATLVCDLGMKDQQAAIRKLYGALKLGGQSAGVFDVNGSYQLASQSGNLSLRVTDLNQNALRPFLASAFGDKKLVSVTVNANLEGRYDGKADSGLKGDLQVANLVVNDPKGQIPSTPLEAKLKLDAGLRKQLAEIRECLVTLTPTERAKNELALTGQVDFSQTNAIQGGLKLASESLDATRYYDLFARKSAAGAQTTITPPPGSNAPAGGDKEPDAMKLPLRNFVFDASIGRFYLREVDIANLQASARIDGGQVVVKPLQLTLNGAPINASAALDLGVPGFKYEVAFSANAIPLAPLVNSFAPERKNQIGGTTTASVQVKGAGVTGASLQKNLAGQFGFSATNLNLSLANVRSPSLNSIINVIVSIPELSRNPTSALGSLLGSRTGAPAARSGWADKLTASPIDAINMRGSAGSGRIELQEAAVRSDAFLAEATGSITLASVLTNSTMQFPVMISLSRALADEVGLVPAGTPTNAPYAKLPDFFAMRGTLGKPEPKLDKLALASVALKTGAGLLGNTGNTSVDKVGGTLGALGTLLGGQPAPSSSQTPTNAPAATNHPAADPAANLLRGLGGFLGGSKSSRAQTNTPPPRY